MVTRRQIVLATGLQAITPLFAPVGSASSFPDRPIRIVVPFAPGGNVDVETRVLAARMSELLGQPVIVENRTGAGGSIGAELVARSRPDGYTLLSGSNGPLTASPAVQPRLSYDPLRDFAPIGLISRVPLALAVTSRLPVRNLAEFVEFAKANPGKVTVGSSGIGGAHHLVIETFNIVTGAGLVHVPYRGGGAIPPDLMAGNVSSTINEVPNVLPLVGQGQGRVLAVAAVWRSPLLPDVATFAEAGISDFTAFSFCGLLAPAGTPPEIVEKLRTAMATALSEAPVRSKLEEIALEIVEPSEMTPSGFAAVLKTEVERARSTARAANIQLN